MTDFTSLGLAPPLLRALTELGYETPTPIQSQGIPHLVDGRDLFGIAQTGTGKTAAFALPALDWIVNEPADPPKRGARVLVLAPTRELVAQIADSFGDYGRFVEGLRVTRVTGGVPINRQIKATVRGNDVLVATPGRLIDLVDRKAVTLKDVEILVLDEADQMMDMGFIHALRKIVPMLPDERQTVFFSATVVPKIRKLAKDFLSDPAEVSVAPANTTADKVEQRLVFASPADKPALLAHHLLGDGVGRALVFTRTKHGADRLVKRLAKMGIPAVAIHGNKSQGQRTRALKAFKDGDVQTLVATDVAARGIDIPAITHVFNYEVPNVAEQYVHRIGRTARADAEGTAVSLVAPDERPYLKDIQKLLGGKIPVEPMPEDFAARVAELQSREAVPLVRLSPEEPKRQGRGKSRKRGSGRPRGKGQGGRPQGERTQGENPTGGKPKAARPAPRSDGGPPKSKRPKPGKAGNTFARTPAKHKRDGSSARRKAPGRNR